MRNILQTAVAEHGGTWAISPDRLKSWASLDAADVPPAKRRPGASTTGSIAVLPLYGIITQRGGGLLSLLFGGTSTERFGYEFDRYLRDDEVDSILIDIDSPGGTVYGVPELADKIRSARGQKPIVAVANSLAASAAYWIGSQADRLVVTPGGEVGSVGVWEAHTDISGAEEKAGVKTTLVSAGKYKVEGHPFAPLDDEAREEMQRGVDAYYAMFVDAVAAGRRTSAERVRTAYGQGRVVRAADALAAGMVDAVSTLEQEITRLARGRMGGDTRAARLRNLAEARLLLAQ